MRQKYCCSLAFIITIPVASFIVHSLEGGLYVFVWLKYSIVNVYDFNIITKRNEERNAISFL